MVRRFRSFRRRRTASPVRRSGRRRSGSSGGVMGTIKSLAAPALYGATRQWISGFIEPQAAKILPASLAAYTDEIGIIGAALLAKKFFPASAPIANAALTIEAASLGEKLAGSMGAGSNNSMTLTISGPKVYS